MELGGADLWRVLGSMVAPAIAAAIAVYSASYNLRNTRLQVFGVPHKTAAQVRRIVVGFVLVSGGIAAIDAVKHDVPLWALFYLPIVALYFATFAMLGHLAGRDSFKWSRFGRVVFSPFMAALAPIGNVILQRPTDILRQFGVPI